MQKPHKKATSNAFGEAVRPGAAAPLGIYPRTVDKPFDENLEKIKESRRIASRRQLYSDLKSSALILLWAMPGKTHAVAKCRWTKIAPTVSLHLMDVGDGKSRAAWKGIKICGNVWGCPVCASRISQTRRAEMNTLLAWARKEGLIPVMLTLTARHGRGDRLADLLKAMKSAKQRLRQRQEWIRLPYVGSVTATEMTYGRSGWHPHFHEIVLLKVEDEAEALAMVAALARAWRVSLRAFGLDGAAAAFDAQGAARAGDYVAKWGAAEEVTLTNSKGGKAGKGETPRELVRRAGAGDAEARELWLEYFAATSKARRKQLVWSPGLKARCGLKDVADEEAAEAESAEEDDQIAEYDADGWRKVRPKRVTLMEAAEKGGFKAVRQAEESGLDDDTWQHEPSVEVIECDDLTGKICREAATSQEHHPHAAPGWSGGAVNVLGRSAMTETKQTDKDRVIRETAMRQITEGVTSSHAEIKRLAQECKTDSFGLQAGQFQVFIELEPDDGSPHWRHPSVNISAEDVANFARELVEQCETNAETWGSDIDDHHYWAQGEDAADPFYDGWMSIHLDEGCVGLTLRFRVASEKDEDDE